MKDGATTRTLGLDVVRTIAIVAVLLCHLLLILWHFVSPPNKYTNGIAILLGYYGVELFFALSGFLIGGILLRDVAPRPSLSVMGIFFVRRFLRILPLYYGVLIFLSLFQWHTSGFFGHWSYFFMMQNFQQGAELFFPVSWSLTIEFWAYLLAPVLVVVWAYLCSRWPKCHKGWLWLLVLGAVCLLVLLVRGVVALPYFGNAPWDMGIRKQIYTRLDAIFFGLGIVVCRCYWPRLYVMLANGLAFVFVCLTLLGLAYLQMRFLIVPGDALTYFHKTFGFSLTGALLALSLPFFDKNQLVNEILGRFSKASMAFTLCSRYAYALYLVHFTIFYYCAQPLTLLLNQPYGLRLGGFILTSCASLLFSFAIAFVLHRLVEQPCMNMRPSLR